MPSLESRLKLEAFYDLYGPLLTPKQQEVFRLHYHDDLSLGEVSEQLGISRPAVADSLRRSEEFLEHCETSMGFLDRLSGTDLRIRCALGLLNKLKAQWGCDDCPDELSKAIEALDGLVQ